MFAPQILVSHHVELLLPITDHIVRILDGKVDAQGSPAELRAGGELDGLIAVEEAEVIAGEAVTSDGKEDKESEAVTGEEGGKKAKKAKGPGKKLVQGQSDGRLRTDGWWLIKQMRKGRSVMSNGRLTSSTSSLRRT